MVDLKSIITNIETIYGSNNSLNILKDFERVVDELDLYVFDNWIDGELVAGPIESKYFVECTFMWDYEKMPDPAGAKRLSDYGCKVQFAESHFHYVRKIRKPEDIRPGTKKGKIDRKEVWLVKILMPKKLMADIQKGSKNLDINKIEDIVNQNFLKSVKPDASEQQIQDLANAQPAEQPAA